MGLCVFSLLLSLVMTVRIYKLDLIIIIKTEVWHICHCLGLSYETIVCAGCLSIFLRYFLLDIPKRHPIAIAIVMVWHMWVHCLTCSLHVTSCCNTPIMTSLNGNNSCVIGPVWGESIGHWWFPSQRPVARTFDVFFEIRLDKRLNKQWSHWWFGTPYRSCNVTVLIFSTVHWSLDGDTKMCPLVLVMACHLFAPNHNLNKYWLIINSERKIASLATPEVLKVTTLVVTRDTICGSVYFSETWVKIQKFSFNKMHKNDVCKICIILCWPHFVVLGVGRFQFIWVNLSKKLIALRPGKANSKDTRGCFY